MQQKTGLYPKQPKAKIIEKSNASEENISHNTNDAFSNEIKQQLLDIFSKFERNLVLKLYLDNRPVSNELESLIENYEVVLVVTQPDKLVGRKKQLEETRKNEKLSAFFVYS